MNVSCNNIDCDQKFNWPVQMYRHLKKCKFPPKTPESKYQRKGEKFEYKKCSTMLCKYLQRIIGKRVVQVFSMSETVSV